MNPKHLAQLKFAAGLKFKTDADLAEMQRSYEEARASAFRAHLYDVADEFLDCLASIGEETRQRLVQS